MPRVSRPKAKRKPHSTIADAPVTTPDFTLDGHLFFWFTQVIDVRDRHLAAKLKPYGLRAPEWRVLSSLHARQRLSMSELADLTSIEPSTLSRTVERMVRKGWLVRLSDTSDMRITRLAPTEAGERLFARIWPSVHRLNQAAVAGLPEPLVATLRWMLQEMRRTLEAVVSEKTKRAPEDSHEWREIA